MGFQVPTLHAHSPTRLRRASLTGGEGEDRYSRMGY